MKKKEINISDFENHEIFESSCNVSRYEDRQVSVIVLRINNGFLFLTGYGFVNFETPDVAQRAVKALKSKGIQAQMAKVLGLCI